MKIKLYMNCNIIQAEGEKKNMKSSSLRSSKTGLKTREVSKDHFSSNLSKKDIPFTRLVVRLLEGYSLLASDVETGKSDPVCFIKIIDEEEPFPAMDPAEVKKELVFMSKVCKTTVDPIWNEDVVIPIQLIDINDILSKKLVILVRDEDIIDGVISYDDLGVIELSFKQFLAEAKILRNSMVLSARKYTLKKSPSMRRVDGGIKMTLTLTFTEEDATKHIERNELGFKSVHDMLQRLKLAGKLSHTNLSQSLSTPFNNDIEENDHNNLEDELVVINNLDNMNKQALNLPTHQSTGLKFDKILDDISNLQNEVSGNKNSSNFKLESVGDPDSLGSTINGVTNPTLGLKTSLDDMPDMSIEAFSLPGRGDETLPGFQETDGNQQEMNIEDSKSLTPKNSDEDKPIANVLAAISSQISQPQPSKSPQLRRESTSSSKKNSEISSTMQPTLASTATQTIEARIDAVLPSNVTNQSAVKLPEALTSLAKDDSVSSSASGNAASAARALREIAQQRDFLKKQLEDLARMTSQGLQSLNQRMEQIEKKSTPKESMDTMSIGSVNSKATITSSSIRPKSAAPLSHTTDRIKSLRDFKRQSLATKLAQTTSGMNDDRKSSSDFNKINTFNAELLIKGANGEIKKNSIRDDIEVPEILEPLNEGNNQDTTTFNRSIHSSSTSKLKGILSSSIERSNNQSSGMRVNWSKIDRWRDTEDNISCFSEALDRGDLVDLAKVMEMVGPKPETLSVSLRNRLFDCIAIMLAQNQNVERCLIWILAIVRGKDLTSTIARHTSRELIDSLQIVGREPSRRGLLASLLASQLEKST